VEGLLRSQFGYGEEFTVNNEVGTLYDADETENLGKKLVDLGKLVQYLSYVPGLTNHKFQASRMGAF